MFGPGHVMTPASAEPTEAQRAREPYVAQAAVLMSKCIVEDDVMVGLAVRLIADALASQRAEIVARYEWVAMKLDSEACVGRGDQPEDQAKFWAATLIREAAPK